LWPRRNRQALPLRTGSTNPTRSTWSRSIRPSIADHGRDRAADAWLLPMSPTTCSTSAGRYSGRATIRRRRGRRSFTSAQYNVGAQTRGTANSLWHKEDLLEFTHTTRNIAASATATGCGSAREPLARDDAARASHRSGGARRGLHDVPSPDTQANVITTDYSDWATNCYKGHRHAGLAVERSVMLAGGL
jgi:hypothetical protein